MTSRLDLSREAYLYAQDLDNEGGTEYWRVCNGDGSFERLLTADAILPLVRDRLDALRSTGRGWLTDDVGGKCRVDYSGDCAISLLPRTLDVDGRISPVVLLFNAVGDARHQAIAALEGIPTFMARTLSDEDLALAASLKPKLGWPGWLVFFNIVLFSRRVPND